MSSMYLISQIVLNIILLFHITGTIYIHVIDQYRAIATLAEANYAL